MLHIGTTTLTRSRVKEVKISWNAKKILAYLKKPELPNQDLQLHYTTTQFGMHMA